MMLFSRELLRARTVHARRPAFTLLELILAVAVSVVLLAGLYLALSTQLNHARSARDVMDEATVARTIFTRMSGDINASLGPSTTAIAVDDSGSDDTDTSTTPAPPAKTLNDMSTSSGPINFGVLGDSQRLVLTVSRVVRDPDPARPDKISDLRTITYWLVNPDKGGLARQEITSVTGSEASNLPPDVPEPEKYIVGAKVKDLKLEYFDGTTWQSSWDGGSIDTETQKAQGPPTAVAITLTIQTSDRIGADGKSPQRTYRHVVAIPAANRPAAMSTTP